MKKTRHVGKGRVFLDHASSTPIRREVLDTMRSYEDGNFPLNSAGSGVGRTFTNVNVLANPSALYAEARKAKEFLISARKDVARALNTSAGQIVFTSGGTEANNLALLGVFEKARQNGITRPHIISLATEHPAIREVLKEIERRGGDVTLVPPLSDGRVNIKNIEEALTPHTVLVSVMYVNNEIGVVQPIRDIAQLLKLKNKDRAHKIYFHTDACQVPLWYGLDMSTLGVDLLSLDGLKIGGPRGIGCLYVKGSTEISPIMWGGGQENSLRSGTEPVSLCLGFACALTLAKAERKEVSDRVKTLRDSLWEKIQKEFPEATLNGSYEYRAPNNLNVCFKGVDAEYLTVALDTYGVCVSYSSSCRTLKEDSTSYVVEALSQECKGSSIRFTLGIDTTQEDVAFAVKALKKAVIQATLI
ncbi:MAG: cysteine desulfurase family protein [Candidatus Zambryskibacteria bacterium]|nr:cysteine desulfurase family protein [Candidatus Zambryskibacteria bacterium]